MSNTSNFSNTCPTCHHDFYEDGSCVCEPDISSEDFDKMVQAASKPNLASLFKAGQDQGLIKPQQEYVSAT